MCTCSIARVHKLNCKCAIAQVEVHTCSTDSVHMLTWKHTQLQMTIPQQWQCSIASLTFAVTKWAMSNANKQAGVASLNIACRLSYKKAMSLWGMIWFGHAATNSQFLKEMERCKYNNHTVFWNRDLRAVLPRCTFTPPVTQCTTNDFNKTVSFNLKFNVYNTQLQLEVQCVLEVHSVMRTTDQS